MSETMAKSSFNSFVDKYVRYDGFVPDDDYFAGLFDGVPAAVGQETRMYDTFVGVAFSCSVCTPHNHRSACCRRHGRRRLRTKTAYSVTLL